MPSSQATTLIDYINQSDRPLTDWEKDFIESIKRQEKTSTKQLNVLSKIYGRVYGGGHYASKQYV